MIDRIDMTGQHMELTDDLKAYIKKKIGKLDKYISRHARKSVHVEVRMLESAKNNKDKYQCEIVLHLPNEVLTAKDSTLNAFAAVDIAETKMRNQLKKYKAKTADHKSDRKGMMSRIRRLADRDYWGSQN